MDQVARPRAAVSRAGCKRGRGSSRRVCTDIKLLVHEQAQIPNIAMHGCSSSALSICNSATSMLVCHLQALCRLQGRISPAEAAQMHRMQAKREEKAELEAMLEQVWSVVAHACLGDIACLIHLLTVNKTAKQKKAASIQYTNKRGLMLH